jgi:hypothetical protein
MQLALLACHPENSPQILRLGHSWLLRTARIWSWIVRQTRPAGFEAMGGKLDIRAKFPAGEVRIRQFGGLARRQPSRTRRGGIGRRAKAAA